VARRSFVGPQDIPILARQAVDEVKGVLAVGPEGPARAEAIAAASQRVLAEAGDPQLQRAIVELSVTAPHEVTGALIVAALRSGDTELARSAVELLTDIRDSPAAANVLRECFASADSTVRCRAVEAIESVSNPDAVSLLPQALKDDSDSVRRAAIATIGLIVGMAYHPLRGKILEELTNLQGPLAQGVVTNSDYQVRRQAAQSLAYVKSDVVLPILRVLCGDEDEDVRQEAVLCLAAIRTPAALDLMGTMLDDESDMVASSALDMLAGRLGGASPQFLKYLKKAMDSSLVEVRRHAVLMLTRFDAKDAVPFLEKATADPDFEVARQAGEILRRLRPDSKLGWLADEMAQQPADERALTVWEAGNIGLQAGRATAATDVRALIPMLEKALREGSASDKVHAVNELSGLVDIADSPAMQDALNDADPAVRSRAADALSYTRDAGLLARVMGGHPDSMIRRTAGAALSQNPGGPKRPEGGRRDIAFSSTRTVGVELFGHFLKALGDPDEGVQQQACSAIRTHAQTAGLLPIKATLEALARLAADERLSYLMQEEVAQTTEVVRKLSLSKRIEQRVDEVLARRGQLARQAHALRWDEGAGYYVVDGAVASDVAQTWAQSYGLSAEQAEHVKRAGSGEAGLDAEAASRVTGGLGRELASALNCVAHAADAIRLIGQEGCENALDRWAAAVQTGPKLEWGAHDGVTQLQRRLYRLGRRAWISVRWAREAPAGQAPSADLATAAADEDDWVKLVGLRACAALSAQPAGISDRINSLCEAHLDDPDYQEPIGFAVPVLLEAGVGEPVRFAETVLTASPVDLRLDLTRRLMVAAQSEQAAAALANHLAGRPVEGLPLLCLALALRGAGAGLAGLTIPAAEAGEEWTEALCADLALQAMSNEAEAVARLEEMLRTSPRAQERYCGAQYLSLARVRSAAIVFASVRDRDDAPYLLRALCAASLLRCGHPAGPGALDMASKASGGRFEADFLVHACRAIEDVIPLMLECADVNVGRFV